MDNNRDRGKIKWTSLMLPEHLERLREWQAEDEYVEKPFLDDFRLEEIQETLERAYKRQCQVEIQCWTAGRFTYYQGIIHKIDVPARQIILEDPYGIDRILVEKVTNAQCLD